MSCRLKNPLLVSGFFMNFQQDCAIELMYAGMGSALYSLARCIMKHCHFLAALLLSLGSAAWPVLAAPPQSKVTTPSGVQGPATSSGGRHVVHPATTDDSMPTPDEAGSPGTEPNGSNDGQPPNGNNNGRTPSGNNDAQNPDGSNNAQNPNGGSPGVTITDE